MIQHGVNWLAQHSIYLVAIHLYGIFSQIFEATCLMYVINTINTYILILMLENQQIMM